MEKFIFEQDWESQGRPSDPTVIEAAVYRPTHFKKGDVVTGKITGDPKLTATDGSQYLEFEKNGRIFQVPIGGFLANGPIIKPYTEAAVTPNTINNGSDVYDPGIFAPILASSSILLLYIGVTKKSNALLIAGGGCAAIAGYLYWPLIKGKVMPRATTGQPKPLPQQFEAPDHYNPKPLPQQFEAANQYNPKPMFQPNF